MGLFDKFKPGRSWFIPQTEAFTLSHDILDPDYLNLVLNSGRGGKGRIKLRSQLFIYENSTDGTNEIYDVKDFQFLRNKTLSWPNECIHYVRYDYPKYKIEDTCFSGVELESFLKRYIPDHIFREVSEYYKMMECMIESWKSSIVGECIAHK